MDETRSESCMLGSSKEYCVYPMTEPSERRRGVIPSPGIFVSVSTSKNPFTTKLPHESPLWVSPHSPRPLPSPSSSHSYSPLQVGVELGDPTGPRVSRGSSSRTGLRCPDPTICGGGVWIVDNRCYGGLIPFSPEHWRVWRSEVPSHVYTR